MRPLRYKGQKFFNEFFRVLVEMRPLYKLRLVSFFFKLTGISNAS